MQQVRQTTRLIALVSFAPLLIFAALQFAASLSARHRSIEVETLENAGAVRAFVDGRIEADAAALSVVATSSSFARADLASARARVEGVVNERPLWRNAVLSDAVEKRILWETGPRAASREVRTAIGSRMSQPPLDLFIGNAVRSCACVLLHQPIVVNGAVRYVLTVERDVADFHDHLDSAIKTGEVAGLVDRNGNFIARTRDHDARLGTQASEYVRQAIVGGEELGLYFGTTIEGLKNRSAFRASPLTGWSVHVAVPRTRLMWLTFGSMGLNLAAAAATLVVALLLSILAHRELRRRRIEELRDVQRQKLEALGQFAGQVAHDFNNLLTVIVGNLQRLQEAPLDEASVKRLANARTAADRSAKLTADLLSFARSKPPEISSVDLVETLAAARPLIEQLLGAKFTLKIDINPRARHIETNREALEIALMNLAKNSADAMPEGGAIEIVSNPAKAHGMTVVAVCDQGCGMAPDVAKRAMEAFFTTKGDGKGTGLGLAQVKSLVVQSGGTLEIHSEPGRGTKVRMLFRAASRAPVVATAEASA